MTVEQLVEVYSPVGDMISLLSSVMILIIVNRVLYFSHDDKFSYLKKAVHLVLVATAANIVFFLLCERGTDNYILLYIVREIYHFCLACCLYLFLLYMKSMLSVQGKIENFVTSFTRGFFVAMMALEICSFATGFGFHWEGELWYDAIVSPFNIFYVYGVTILMIMIVGYADRLIKSVRQCLIAVFCLVAVVMTVSAIKNTNTISSFTYVLPIFVVMILLHSKPFNDKTGALSAEGFGSFVAEAARKKIIVDYMVLQLNLNVENQLPDELGKVLNSFWHPYFHNALLFSLEQDLWVLGIPRISRNGDTAKKMQRLFDEEFPKYYEKYQIPYKMMGLPNISFIATEKDVRGIINYMLLTMDENSLIVADDKKAEEFRLLRDARETLIDIEKKNDLDDPRVVVFCQPIKNMATGKFDTGEALMRLNVPGEGLVPPYLFIPLAENYGYIRTLTKIMLNKVCKQLKEFEREGYYFKRVSVNVTTTDTRADDFCDSVLSIIKMNDIDPTKIGIELTESQTENDFKIVKEKMSILKRAGITQYLDDVGTGYSNLDRIVRYGVDVVKFDRFFLLEAEKNQNVAKMMGHLAKAFKDLNYELLYEGVETTENEQLCLECGAEYIQGFLYSKPIPIEQMREFFEN